MHIEPDHFSADSAPPAPCGPDLQRACHRLERAVAHSSVAASLSGGDARALTHAIAQGRPVGHTLSAKLMSHRVHGSAKRAQHLDVLMAMLSLLAALPAPSRLFDSHTSTSSAAAAEVSHG